MIRNLCCIYGRFEHFSMQMKQREKLLMTKLVVLKKCV